jgi:uncharacterized protein YkwD
LVVLFCALAALICLLGPSAAQATPKRRQPPRRPNLHIRRWRCVNASLVPSRSNVRLVARATLCLVNRERAAQGITLLAENTALDHAASTYSGAMVSGDYFGDVSPSGSTLGERIAKSGYLGAPRPRSARLQDAENLATAGGELATPAKVVEAWMASPPHRANLLGADFVGSGIGVALGMPASSADGWHGTGATYTEYFGTIR